MPGLAPPLDPHDLVVVDQRRQLGTEGNDDLALVGELRLGATRLGPRPGRQPGDGDDRQGTRRHPATGDGPHRRFDDAPRRPSDGEPDEGAHDLEPLGEVALDRQDELAGGRDRPQHDRDRQRRQGDDVDELPPAGDQQAAAEQRRAPAAPAAGPTRRPRAGARWARGRPSRRRRGARTGRAGRVPRSGRGGRRHHRRTGRCATGCACRTRRRSAGRCSGPRSRPERPARLATTGPTEGGAARRWPPRRPAATGATTGPTPGRTPPGAPRARRTPGGTAWRSTPAPPPRRGRAAGRGRRPTPAAG